MCVISAASFVLSHTVGPHLSGHGSPCDEETDGAHNIKVRSTNRRGSLDGLAATDEQQMEKYSLKV